jgi:RNA polymerase sigma-70 factor (ECF subfamily)
MARVRESTTDPDRPAEGAPTLDGLYRAHAAQVARWAAHLGGPRLEVGDLVQEVFIVAGRRLADFRGDAKVTTWLYGITERVALAARRKERVRRFLDRVRRVDVERSLVPSQPTPVEELDRRQAQETVYRILDRLPEKYRRVMILFTLEELPGEAIAELTGMKLATVWVHLHRARRLFLDEVTKERAREEVP